MGRPEATHVAKLGAWQYEHAVSGLGRPTIWAPERVGMLPALADLMLQLLGADLCRIAIHDPETRTWTGGPLSGRWWDKRRLNIEIAEDDEGSATVRAAKKGRAVVIPDVQEAGRSRPPNGWVRGCVALPLVREDAQCDTVITLWHHVVDWFSQFDNSLLDSLAAIGGARVHQVQAVEAVEQEETIKSVAKHIAHSLGSQLPEESFSKLVHAFEGDAQQDAEKCLTYVRGVHRMKRRFLLLSDMVGFAHDGPHEARALFESLNVLMNEGKQRVNLIYDRERVALGSCEFVPFRGRILCNAVNLHDDIMELMLNSAKYGAGDAGGDRRITMSLQMRAADMADFAGSPVLASRAATTSYAVIEFRDDGVGIPQKKRPGVFETKGGARAREAATGSLGLGLPLARTLAQTLGGDLVELGNPEGGVRFLFFFVRIL
jgi:signal transduction histidine kinase